MCLRVHSDLNRLVLDYLFVEGYKSTAENFARESKTYDECDLEGVDQRTAIRYAIHRGDIDAAIEQLNDLNSEVNFISFQLIFPFPLYYDSIFYMHHSQEATSYRLF